MSTVKYYKCIIVSVKESIATIELPLKALGSPPILTEYLHRKTSLLDAQTASTGFQKGILIQLVLDAGAPHPISKVLLRKHI